MYHNNLGILLWQKFDKTASLDDIDEAIQHGREAVNAGVDGVNGLVGLFLSHLARSLSSRFTKSEVIGDLDEAVQKGWEAVAGIPPGHPNQATCLNNLGNILIILCSISKGTMKDMEEAINCGQQSLKACSPKGLRWASFLQELATWFVKRFEKTKATTDLDKAIGYGLQAIEATPPGDGERAGRLKQLRVMYGLRFESTETKEDSENASRYAHEAAGAALPECPDPSLHQR